MIEKTENIWNNSLFWTESRTHHSNQKLISAFKVHCFSDLLKLQSNPTKTSAPNAICINRSRPTGDAPFLHANFSCNSAL